MKEKFDMFDQRGHEHIKRTFKTMRRGEIVWIKFGEKYHDNLYHKFCKKGHLAPDYKPGQFIWMKLHIFQVKRNPLQKKKDTFEDLVDYFEQVREVGKEVVVEKEFMNAKNIYTKTLGMFKNMQKKLKDALTEEQSLKRNEVMTVLNLNLALVLMKLNQPVDAERYAADAVKLDPKSSKAHYRHYLACFEINELEKARESLKEAINLEPGNKLMRQNYKEL